MNAYKILLVDDEPDVIILDVMLRNTLQDF